MSYWKVGSRKLFGLRPNSRISKRRCLDSEFDDDYRDNDFEFGDVSDFDVMSASSGRYRKGKAKDQSFKKLDGIVSDITDIKEKMKALTEVSTATPVPLSLLSLLRTTFKCHICQDIISPPVTYASCCQSIIGCESCVDDWFKRNGEGSILTEKCPHCQSPRGFANSQRMKGLDDFLTAIKELVSPSLTSANE